MTLRERYEKETGRIAERIDGFSDQYVLWLEQRVDMLEDYILADAECPCCGEITTCPDDCTYKIDNFEGWEKMDFAREILKEYRGE